MLGRQKSIAVSTLMKSGSSLNVKAVVAIRESSKGSVPDNSFLHTMIRQIRILSATFLWTLFGAFAWGADNSAIIPSPQKGMEKRHAEKVESIRKHRFDLLLIGDSIVHNFDRPQFKAVWDQFFAPRNAIDLGYSGGRTENILWNLANGEMDGQSPKVAVVLIGTNNSDDANFAVINTPEQIAEGAAAIVNLIREKSPATKVLLLRIFPRWNVYKKPDGAERGDSVKRFATNLRAGELVERLSDSKNVFFLDVNHVFLGLDGKIDRKLMPDLLHPSPKGALAWARAMEPTLCELLSDTTHDTPSANTAIIPSPKLENDFYDWPARHEAVLKIKDQLDPEIVLVGDSITHLWGGEPSWAGRKANGQQAFEKTFPDRRVLNLGYGWDRIQNVLWRLDHGEFDGQHAEVRGHQHRDKQLCEYGACRSQHPGGNRRGSARNFGSHPGQIAGLAHHSDGNLSARGKTNRSNAGKSGRRQQPAC